ncbi:hypothetical protein [Nakamurella lactea]|uniref:hypothetical protein n=1 Tax=Nakamurella lactea TaxID=459515 RepID=UPI000561D13D|nr:hypothetical protein [Nakamurella lactea]
MARTPDGAAERPDPERVLSQALRAMAGGRPAPHSAGTPGSAGAADHPGRRRGRLTVAQVLLIAAILGLVIGMGVAFVLVAVS